jgi:GTP-binding protein Era
MARPSDRDSASGSPNQASSSSPATRTGLVALVGRPNVGKSTLVNALVGEHVSIVSHHAQTTRDRVVGVVNEPGLQLVLVDTPGVHSPRNKLGVRMNHEAREALAGADVVVFITEVTPAATPELSPSDLEVLAGVPRDKPVLLVVNKIDRVKSKAALLPLLAKRAEAFPFAAIVPISAKKQNGLDRLRKEIDERVPKGPKLYDDEIFSDRPARFFVQEYVREQVLRLTREEVPHGVAVTVDRWDEGKKVPHIEVTVHVDKPNHKKIVIGQGGSVLKEVGTRARARVEALLGRPVMLKLWVRVTPGWYESDRLLRDLGYGDEG